MTLKPLALETLTLAFSNHGHRVSDRPRHCTGHLPPPQPRHRHHRLHLLPLLLRRRRPLRRLQALPLPLPRPPSPQVLQGFNLYSSYRPSDLATTTEIPKSEECVAEPEPEPQPEQQEHHIVWSQSDAQPTAGEMPKKLAKKLATLKLAFNHFDFHEPPEQESSPPKRPATMREGEREKEEAADQVDAIADDFINRFKQQLKLQRLDSIIRYREMLN